MRLYYFTSEQYGLEAIRNSRLKLAMINELNDPFEFLGLSLPGLENRENRKALRLWKESMSKKFGLICMSKNWHNPLLWSHYADEHKGMCLGFDCPDDSIFEHMNYVSKRPTLQEFGGKDLAAFDMNDMNRMLRLKFRAWIYEEEYRGSCALVDRDPVTDLYFTPFSEKTSLAQVIVGQRSEVTRDELEQCLGKTATAVRVFRARSSFTKFEVVENTRQSAWQ